MTKWIRDRELTEGTDYKLHFDRPGTGSGFCFECDAEGNILDPYNRSELGWRNLWECVLGLNGTEFRGVVPYRWSHWDPAAIECGCGAEIELWDPMTNTCQECGTEYNGSGQRLAPRHQWGEETGEHFSCSCGSCEDY